MDETKTSIPSGDKLTDKDYKKKRVEEIGSTLAQIKARVKANRTCARKDDDSKSSSPKEILSEKSEKYMQVLQRDKAKAQKLEKERPKMKEAIENMILDRENQKLVEKKIEETRAKQSAPLPEIPVEVQKRISDMELTIHNLKETLSEKERVLESKTESWRLLSDQLEQRNIEVVDRYEVMSREIDEVKRTYGEQEVFLRQELERCKQRLQDSESLVISQENDRRDTEEMKTKLEDLEKTHFQCETRMESEKKLSLRLKAQLKKTRNELNSTKGLTDEVERLQNVIAGLEEEKGNHLLQLIDFDEYKESSETFEKRATELESRVQKLEEDLATAKQHQHQLYQEKESLSTTLGEKEELIGNLRQSLQCMEQRKISAEFRAAELEEKLEAEGSDKMTKELDNLVCHVREQDAHVEELLRTIAAREEEILVLKEGHKLDLQELLEEWKDKYIRVEESVSEVQEEKFKLTERLTELQGELEAITTRNEVLVSELVLKEEAINQHSIKNQELTESLTRLEDRQGPSHGDDHTQKLKKLAANLKIKVKLCKDLEEKISELSDKVAIQENSIAKLTVDKTELETLVIDYDNRLSNVGVGSSSLVADLQQLLSEKDQIIKSLREQQQGVEQLALQRARTESHGEIQHLKEENLLLESRLNENLIEIHCVDEERGSSDLMVQTLKSQLENKVKDLEEMETLISDLRARLESLTSSDLNNKTLLSEQATLIDELKNELSTLKTSEQVIQSSINEKENLLQTIRNLEEDLLMNKALISTKETIISNFEQEIIQRDNQLQRIEELYSQETCKREEEMSLIEINVKQSNAEIIRLYEELGEMSRNYDQCMDNMKMKDKYIDELEIELNNMKIRVKAVETSIEEKQKSMEERALQLGQKLDQAASKNIDFEQYRVEMEKKLKIYEDIERELVSKANDMQQELNKIKCEKEQIEEDRIRYVSRVQELESELNDIKGAYNTTLDQIELLNGELKQVMDQIEHRNKELVRIGEERNRLIEKLGDLEETCTGLQTQLRGYEEQSAGLRTELDIKLRELDTATAEITNLQLKLGSGSPTADLNRELQELRIQYEQRLSELQVEKNDLLNVLRGSVEPELDSVVQAAEVRAVKTHDTHEKEIDMQGEIKMFSWEGHIEVGKSDHTAGVDVQAQPECDDDWGWNATEARLEEEHQNSDANRIRTLESELSRITSDKNKLEEESKTLKIKCSKLVSKVKELKSQVERKPIKAGLDDLDMALQEELKSQVDELDKKNKELFLETNTMKAERERLSKRIETLTSANNQLIEMKERQDVEMQVWQRNCAELKNQIQSLDFDWSVPEAKHKSSPQVLHNKEENDKILSQMEDKLIFMEKENEELLQIICSLKDEKQSDSKMLTELSNLKKENSALKLAAQISGETNEEVRRLISLLEAETQEKLSLEQRATEEKSSSEGKLQEMRRKLEQDEEEYRSLVESSGQQINTFKADLEVKSEQIISLNENIDCLRETIKELSADNEKLRKTGSEIEEMDKDLKNRFSQFEDALEQNKNLLAEKVKLSKEIERLNTIIETLNNENANIKASEETKIAELYLLRADMKLIEASKDSAVADLHALREELDKARNTEDNQSVSKSFLSSMFGEAPSSSLIRIPNVSVSANDSHGLVATNPFDSSIQEVRGMDNVSLSQSPPVFKGFFSDQTDSFTSVVLQQQVEPSQEVTRRSPAMFQETTPKTDYQSDGMEALKVKISQLELENFNLVQKLNESHSTEDKQISPNELLEKENEIKLLHSQILRSNEEMEALSLKYETEVGEIKRLNQELERKLNEYERLIESERNEVNRLRSNINEFTSRESQHSDLDSLKQHADEQLRQAELNYRNLLLNKDEENAHLVCELSASRQNCEKLTQQVDVMKGQVLSLESELKHTKERCESLTIEIVNLNSNIEELTSDCSQLSKTNEDQLQFYTAQVDYLQLSVQDKDSTLERFSSQVNELTMQISSLQQQMVAANERSSYLENCYSILTATHNELTSEYTSTQNKLTNASAESERLNGIVANLTHELNEHRTTSQTHQSTHSNTVLQIEQLHSAIAEKDLEIERLSKLLTGVQEKLIKAEESKVTDEMMKLKGRLDESLYTLHLRDVKCDELTREIMQLLEERDGLQLRLSEALRISEILRVSVSEPNSIIQQPSQLKESPSTQQLNEKIGELHTGYMKEPAVQMDLQSRHNQQMHLFTSSYDGDVLASKADQKPSSNDPASSDYGIFNWFFSSSTSPQPNEDLSTT